MNDRIDAPKITVTLRTHHVETEPPMLGFVRWKLMPVENVTAVEPDMQEDQGLAERTRTP